MRSRNIHRVLRRSSGNYILVSSSEKEGKPQLLYRERNGESSLCVKREEVYQITLGWFNLVAWKGQNIKTYRIERPLPLIISFPSERHPHLRQITHSHSSITTDPTHRAPHLPIPPTQHSYPYRKSQPLGNLPLVVSGHLPT